MSMSIFCDASSLRNHSTQFCCAPSCMGKGHLPWLFGLPLCVAALGCC